MVEEPKKLSKNDRKYYMFALRIMGDFGVTLAVPIVILAVLGQKIDTKYGTGSLFMILGFATAALLSGIMIYKKAKKYGEEYQRL